MKIADVTFNADHDFLIGDTIKESYVPQVRRFPPRQPDVVDLDLIRLNKARSIWSKMESSVKSQVKYNCDDLLRSKAVLVTSTPFL